MLTKKKKETAGDENILTEKDEKGVDDGADLNEELIEDEDDNLLLPNEDGELEESPGSWGGKAKKEESDEGVDENY